ncbi:hypothetical protein EJD97_011858 [Solanum chilense]|uniref:RNase III domain-containing protein n=1 Tax=Solanum chilense TaxID=4083 RepID=A0A6N2BEU8_SOLCI|nr:hypothetical protein EJD97_011858 [Solanum chilense]
MNASHIKSKGSRTADSYWQNILDLENLMNSKVYTYSSESVQRSLGIYYHMCIPRIHKILDVNDNSPPFKDRLHLHILHTSQDMQREIFYIVENFEKFDIVSILGWESETTFPNVVGDVVRNFIGAIFVDSSFEKDT